MKHLLAINRAIIFSGFLLIFFVVPSIVRADTCPDCVPGGGYCSPCFNRDCSWGPYVKNIQECIDKGCSGTEACYDCTSFCMTRCTGCPPACFRPGTKVLVKVKKPASNAASPAVKVSFAQKAVKELQDWFSEAGKRLEYSLSGLNLKVGNK